MKDKNKVPMISSEIASLWSSYINDSLGFCMLKYFINTVEDEDIKKNLKYALGLSEKHIKLITDFLNEEGLPIPKGFSDEDVNVNAPKLFTDSFSLFYLSNMGRIGMAAYALSLNQVARGDIRDYFTDCVKSSMELYNKVSDTLLSLGLFIRAPRIEVPKEVSFVKKNSFLSGFYGKARPLLASELMHLFSNVLTNLVGRSLITGFSQVTNSKEVREYMLKGVDISSKHMETFRKILSKENIPIPSTYESFVTDSTTPTFSNKLMMFHVSALSAAGIGNYGVSSSLSFRSDIIGNYVKLTGEIALYAEDGANILINNGWFEQPPQAINHKSL